MCTAAPAAAAQRRPHLFSPANPPSTLAPSPPQVGVLKARQLAARHRLRLVHVHHMEAHALVARMAAGGGRGGEESVTAGAEGDAAAPAAPPPPAFPFLCLLVSGGHNLLLLVRGVGDYVQLGSTLDDALGEAYDKVARMLGLGLDPSGGAVLEACARAGRPDRFRFAVPMRKHANCDFSYAGLKTSARMAIEAELGPGGAARIAAGDVAALQTRADLAASFQAVAVQHLCERTTRGIEWAREMEPRVRTLVVAGGVAANALVRSRLAGVAAAGGLELVVPPPAYCTDNGAMVAWAGLERLALGDSLPPPPSEEPAEGEWIDLRPRWPLTSERHARSMQAPLSARKERMHAALSDAKAAAAAAGVH